MIGLDTNVLVRLVVQDDPRQAEQAKRFVEHHCTPDSPGFINSVVLAELVWVLAGPYGYKRDDIASALEALLAGGDRILEHPEAVRASIKDYRAGGADFVDALIGHINRTSGCTETATFDKKAARLDGFVMVT